MRDPDLGDIDVEEFREHGHQAVEWIASYLETMDERRPRRRSPSRSRRSWRMSTGS